MFVFDESYKILQAQGGAVNLAPWYNQEEISLLHAAFVCGSEEVVLVDSGAQARVFSFVTLQFRCDFSRSYNVSDASLTDSSEDPLLYSFHRFPARYSPPQMGLVS
jgi:hypothetical protein